MEPTLMNESWYCSYRYKGAPETNPELMTYGGIDISTNSTKKPNVEFGEEIDDLY
ncbi:MAG: hypothetical protein MUO31_00855 [Thermodesulfovibrionales bacterium]|nr:hypothetical protein [Thermodesulfovibrionales bacterium]